MDESALKDAKFIVSGLPNRSRYGYYGLRNRIVECRNLVERWEGRLSTTTRPAYVKRAIRKWREKHVALTLIHDLYLKERNGQE
jgi:hypothetical protein